MESFHGWKRKKCHKNIHNGAVQAQKEREPVPRFPLKKCLFMWFQLAEVALQQALESLGDLGVGVVDVDDSVLFHGGDLLFHFIFVLRDFVFSCSLSLFVL